MKKLLKISARVLALIIPLTLLAACAGNGESMTQPSDTSLSETREPSSTEPTETQESGTTEIESSSTAPDSTESTAFDAVAIFESLNGYWNATDEHFYWFVVFEYYNDQPCLTYGYWGGEGVGFGELKGGKRNADGTVELDFLFPERGDGVNGPYPETLEKALLDLSGFERNGTVKMKIANHGGRDHSGDWYTYTYGGKTSAEANPGVFA